MEAPTQCSDPVISDTNHASQGSSMVSPQLAGRDREFFFLGDRTNDRLGRNGRDCILQESSFARTVEETYQLYTEPLQSRGMQ